MSLICSLIDLVLMSKTFFIDLDKTSFLGRSFIASGSSSLIKSKIFFDFDSTYAFELVPCSS